MGIKLGYNKPLLSFDELEELKRAQLRLEQEQEQLQQDEKIKLEVKGNTIPATPQEPDKYVSSDDVVRSLRGNDRTGHFTTWTDEEVYDYAASHNPGLEKDLYKPTHKEIASESWKMTAQSLMYDTVPFLTSLINHVDITTPQVKKMHENENLKRAEEGLPEIPWSDEPTLLQKFAIESLEQGKKARDKYLNENPEALAIREYMSGNKLMDMKKGWVTQVLGGTVPVQAIGKATGFVSSVVAGGATALGTGNPYLVSVAAAKGYRAGEAASIGVIEGMRHLSTAYEYLTEDRVVPKSQFDDEVADKRKELEGKVTEDGLYWDEDLQGQFHIDEGVNRFMNDNYTEGENLVPELDVEGRPTGRYHPEIIKKGMSQVEALEIATNAGLYVGVVNGIIETISTTAAVKGMTGKDLSELVTAKWFGKTVDKIQKQARRVPQTTGFISRVTRYGPEEVRKFIVNNGSEAFEEILQGLNDEFTGYFTWSDEPWNFGFEDALEAGAAGFVGSALTGAHLPVSKALGVSHKISNLKVKNMAPKGEGWGFFVNKLGPKKFQINYKNVTSDADGKLMTNEGVVSPTDPTFAGMEFSHANEFNTFEDAYRVLEVYTESQAILDKKTAAWNSRNYANGEVKIETNKEDDDRFDVNVYNQKGELLEVAEVVNTYGDAKRLSNTIEQNINTISKWHRIYGGNEGLRNDPDIQKYERLQNTGGRTNQSSKNIEALNVQISDIPEKDIANLAIKAFMSETLEDPADNEVATQLLDEGVQDSPEVFLKYASQADKEVIDVFGKKRIEDTFNVLFDERPDYQVNFDKLSGILKPPTVEGPPTAEGPIPTVGPTPTVAPVGAPVGKPKKSPVEGMNVSQIESYIAEQQKIVDKGKPETMPVVTAKNRITIAKKQLAELKKAPAKKDDAVDVLDSLEEGIVSAEQLAIQTKTGKLSPEEKVKLKALEIYEKQGEGGILLALKGAGVSNLVAILRKNKGDKIADVFEKELTRMLDAAMKARKKAPKVEKKAPKLDVRQKKKIAKRLSELYKTRVDVDDPKSDFDYTPMTMRKALEMISKDKDVKILDAEAADYIKEIRELEEALDTKKKEPPKLKIELTPQEKLELEAKEKRQELTNRLDMLSEKFKGRIKYKIFDTQNDNVLRLKDEQGVAEEAEAWYNPNDKTIYVIADRAALSTPFHEFAHPFVEEIRLNNPKLYDKLYADILDTKEGKALSDKIVLKYTEANAEFDVGSDAFKDEIIVFSLEKLSDSRYTPQGKFMRTVRRFWDSILEFIFGKSFMNNIYAGELSPNTTLEDLAKILADDKGRYAISIEETADFASIMNIVNDVTQDNTDDKNLISNMGSILTDGFLAGSNAISNLTSEIEDRIVLAISKKEDIPKAINNFINEISKRYSLDIGEYKGDKFIADYQPVTKARDVIVERIKSDIQGVMPEQEKLPDKLMNKLQDVFTEIEGRIQFRYKLVDKVLSKKVDSGVMVNVKDLPKDNVIKGSREEKFVQDFVDKHWSKNFPGRNTALASEIIPEYQKWADNYFPVYSSQVAGYETSLHYDRLFDISKVSYSAPYRIMLHNGTIFKNPKDQPLPEDPLHVFDFPPFDGSVTGNGYGWYTVLKLSNGDIFLHEYQSDILPELKAAVSQIKKDKKTGEIKPLTKENVVRDWKSSSEKSGRKKALDAVISSLDLESLKSGVISNNEKSGRLKIDFVDTSRKYSRKDLKYYLKKNPFVGTATSWYKMPQLVQEVSDSIIEAIGQYNKANNLSLEDETSLFTLISNIIINDLVISNTKDNLKNHYEEIAANIITEERHFAGGTVYEGIRISTDALSITRNNVGIKIGKAIISEDKSKYRDIVSLYKFYDANKGLFSKTNDEIFDFLDAQGFSDTYLYNVLKSELNNYEKTLNSIGHQKDFFQKRTVTSVLFPLKNTVFHNRVDKIKDGKLMDETDIFFIKGEIKNLEDKNISATDRINNTKRVIAQSRFITDNINPDKTADAGNNISQLFPILVKKYTLEYMRVRLANNTAFNAIKNIDLEKYIKEDGNIDANLINDMYENALNDTEIEQALRIDKHWFPTLILHSFMHSRHLSGDNKIYISTGEANTLVQGGDKASGLYSEGGMFKKSLDKLAKKHGVKVKIVQLAFAKAPLIEITLPEKGNLNPPRFKIPLDKSADEKFVPHSEGQVNDNIRRKLSYFEDYRTMSRSFLVNLLNDSWDHMNRIAREDLGRKGRVDLQDFTAAMIDVLPEELHDFYTDWTLNKFQSAKDKAYVQKDTDKGAKYSWLDAEDILNEAIDITDEKGIREGLNDLRERGHSDEKRLGQNEMYYLRELGMKISEQQFRRMRAAARTHNNFGHWSKHILSTILKKTTKISVNTEDGLKKYYNRIRSTLKTNGDVKVIDGRQVGQANQRANFVIKKTSKKVKGTTVKGIEVEIKGPKNIITRTSNNQYEKTTPFEHNIRKNLFAFISGDDVLEKRPMKDENGEPKLDRTGAKKQEWAVSYNFLSEEQLQTLSETLKEQDMAIAFSRGTDDKLGIVRVKDEHKDKARNVKTAEEYWNNREKYLGKTQDEIDKNIRNFLRGDAQDRAIEIAVYEAMSAVWPKYLLDPKGGANVYKRIKIPFTPVTISHEMPSFRVVKFDPKEVLFNYGDKSHSPIKTIKGIGPVYIGDGNSLTSRALFDLFNKFHGLRKGTAKAKTVIYEKTGDNVIAIKHEHVLPRKDWKITDKSGKVMFTIDKNSNIKDANGEIVHMLVTSDEAKIWDFTENDIGMSGTSLGFIKYDEDVPKFVKHGVQWYNHVFSRGIFNMFNSNYLPTIENEIRNLYRMTVQGRTRGPSEHIAGFMKRFEGGKGNEGYIPFAVELAKVGAGLHRSIAGVLNYVMQNQMMSPALNYSKANGSRYEISMDVTGNIEENEVSLSKDNSRMVYQSYADYYNITLSDTNKLPLSEINEWLEENIVEVMVSRYPIPHAAGAYIARVKSLHNRKGLADLNHINVKRDLEGDGDGDEVQIELLVPEVLAEYKSLIRGLKPKSVNLNMFSPKKIYNLSSKPQRNTLIYKSTIGTKAIGEIANIQSVYGMMANLYSSVEVSNTNLRLKSPDEIITWDVFYDGKRGWKGTVSEFLRIYLQAAVDNGEYGLLGEWGYAPGKTYLDPNGQEKVWMKLFEVDIAGAKRNLDPNETHDLQWFFRDGLRELINIHKSANNVRRGKDFKVGKYHLENTIDNGDKYYAMMKDNRKGMVQSLARKGIKVKWISEDRGLMPIEEIAIAPARILEEMEVKHNLFGYEISPYFITKPVHENAHADAMKYMEANLKNILSAALRLDGNKNLEWARQERVKGSQYARQMGNRFYDAITSVKNLGPQTIDHNEDFIAFKEEFDSKFRDLSNTAKVAATYTFLRGYMRFDNKVKKFHKNANFPEAIPPVSGTKGEYTLLSPAVMKSFFKSYNNNAVLNRKTDTAELPGFKDIDKVLGDICASQV